MFPFSDFVGGVGVNKEKYDKVQRSVKGTKVTDVRNNPDGKISALTPKAQMQQQAQAT